MRVEHLGGAHIERAERAQALLGEVGMDRADRERGGDGRAPRTLVLVGQEQMGRPAANGRLGLLPEPLDLVAVR